MFPIGHEIFSLAVGIEFVGAAHGHDCPKGAVKFCALFGGGHEVDWSGVHVGSFGCIESELVLFTVLDQIMLGGEEDVWRELCNPWG